VQSFETFPEQDEAKRLLAAALADGPAHAYLLHGPRGVGKASLDRVIAFATSHGISATEAFERAAEVDGLAPAAVEGYRALRSAIDRSGVAEAERDLVSRLRALLGAVDDRVEVVRSYSDPMVREARWAGVEEILNLAEIRIIQAISISITGTDSS